MTGCATLQSVFGSFSLLIVGQRCYMDSPKANYSDAPLLERLEPRLLLSGNVLVSEFMADNGDTLIDGDGNSPDWIELYNPTDAPVDLAGWCLTDDSDELDQWAFPSGGPIDIVLDPGEYLVVFASGEDDDDYPYDDGTYYHTNFKLSPDDGDEDVVLVEDDGTTIAHAYYDYPEQFKDISYGIYLGSAWWDTLVGEGAPLSYHVPTPGDTGLLPAGGEEGWTAIDFDDSTWTDATVFGAAGIVITEINTGDPNFVEIQNVSIGSVNTTGWTVLVNNGPAGINSVNSAGWQLPGSIASEQILFRSDDPADGADYWGEDILWDLEGPGWAMVIDDAGEVMDFVAWEYSEAQIASLDISYGGFDHITVGGQWSGDGADLSGGGEPEPEEDAIESGPAGATWDYLHPTNGVDPAGSDSDFHSTWMQPAGYDGPAFDKSGEGILGYGAIALGPIETNIGQPPGGSRYTAYFRGEFVLDDPMVEAGIEILNDDGAFIYIDGEEVARNNISPAANDTYKTFANGYTYPDGANTENVTRTLSITDLDAGTHTIAVSIHQSGTDSSDLGFDLRLFGRPVRGGELLRRTGGSDGDTISDFQTSNEATRGTRNPGLSVLFGEVLDTTTGIGFSDDQAEFEDIIETDAGAAMEGVNASLWTRIEFQGSVELSAMGTLTLSMMYDDGFAAYLNGVQVAHRNKPGTLAYDSAATAAHADPQAVVYEEIDITAHMGLLLEDTNVLAIHGLNFGASDADFLIRPKLVAMGDESMPRHFAVATPEEVNTEEWWHYVEDTEFDHDRGFYTDPFNLVISTDTVDAQIYYTTNGTSPLNSDGSIHPDATEYTAPIPIATTTVVRAVAVKPTYAPTNVDAQTYLFLDDVINQPIDPAGFPSDWRGTTAEYDMDPDVVLNPIYQDQMIDALQSIPTMSIVMDVDDMFGSNGIYSNPGGGGLGWERPTSVEWINTDGTTGFQVNAGIRIYGGAFRGMGLTRKKTFRLLFKGVYGPTKLNFDMFETEGAATSFDNIVLRGGANDGWNSWGGANTQYIIDEYMRRLQLALGEPSGHGTFVHLYINGLYWGLYNPIERPEASFCATYFGGDKEDWDGINAGAPTGESNTATWGAMLGQVSGGLSDMASYQKIQGNDPDGTNNPNYDDLLDVDNYIAYMFSNFWGGTGDWPGHNYYAACHRPPDATGFKFFNWDAEGAICVWSNLNSNVTGVSGGAGAPYSALRQNPEFRMLFADHAHKYLFNGGPATVDASFDRYKELADEVELAIIAESARWGDTARSTPYTLADWSSKRDNVLGTYMPQRPAIVLGQLKSAGLYPNVVAPSFNINSSYQHGGTIDLGDSLSIYAPAGTIYYTLDGADPRELGGGISPDALTYSDAVTLDEGAHVMSRVYAGGAWSTLNEAAYYLDLAPDIRITEIMYNPAAPTQGEIDLGYDDSDDDFEFIEITNVSDQTLPLEGLQFGNGIDFTFGKVSIAPGEFVVVASNPAAFSVRYPDFAGTVLGPFGSGTQLANDGEKVELDSPNGVNVHEFSYGDGWYDHTDGDGFSLTIRNPEGALDLWGEKEGWRASAAPGGTPGANDTLVTPSSIVINEVLAHSDTPLVDMIELRNTSGSPVDVSGWFLSDAADNLTKYEIPTLGAIDAMGYLVLREDTHFGGAFSLSELGDDVYLSSNAGGVAGGYREHVDFGASPNGVSIGVHAKSTGGTDFTLLSAHSFGSANRDPYFENLVINEIMYHPVPPTQAEIDAGFTNNGDFEFIEIYNRSEETLDLTDLKKYYVGSGIGFTFGWYDADGAGAESWTLEPGATATWNATLPGGPGSYEVFARWDLLDGELDERNLDGQAAYSITHNGGTTAVIRDQKPELDDEGPDYMDENGWVSLGAYDFNGSGQVVLTRGTNDPDNWTIADQVKFVRAGFSDVVVDAPTLDSWCTANGPATLGPEQYAVIVSNYDAFNYRYNNPAITIAGEYTGNLSNDGEKVKLMRAGDAEPSGFIPYYRIDYVNYDDNLPWPTEPDGTGPSLSRNDPGDPYPYGNDAGNWLTSASWGSPGGVNSAQDTTPPTVPGNVAAQVGVPYTQVELTWDASQDPGSYVDHYVIYRAGEQIGTSDTPAYTDTDVVLLAPYSYEISAVNRDGLESARCAAVEITIPGLVSYSTPADAQIVLVFSEPLVEASAELLANYTFVGGTLQGASLETGNMTVTLTTTELQPGQVYTLTVGSLATGSGVLMPPDQQISFMYSPVGSGTILREYWTGISGGSVWHLTSNANYPDNPAGQDELTGFEVPANWADNYGTRVRGYVHPPESGFYTFWLASNDNSELWLSTDAYPPGATLIASVVGWTNSLQWDKYPSQQSEEVYLSAGQKYYIEALQKESSGDDHLAVAWQRTGGTFEGPIPGARLSPWVDNNLPLVISPIGDVTVDEDAGDTVRDLAGVFNDPDVGDNLTFSVTGNTNAGMVTAGIAAAELHLSWIADQNGTAEITVRATDPCADWVEDTFTVTVNPIDDAPRVASEIGDVTVDEDAGDTVLDLAGIFYDPDAGDSLTLSVTSNTNTGMVTTSLPDDELTLSYIADRNGTAEITVRAVDPDGDPVEDTFTVTVGPVNDAPFVAGEIDDVVVDENAGDTVLDLAAAFGDVDILTNGDSLTFSVEGNTNPGLVDTSVLGTLSYTSDEYGTAEITVRATDQAAAWVEDTFTVGVGSDGAATVDHVLVKGSSWSAAFSNYLDAQGLGHPTLSHLGYRISDGAEQLDTLPWNNLDKLVICFSKNVNVTQSDLVLYDVSAAPYAIVGFVYTPSTFTATWTLGAPIGADKLLIDLSDSVHSGGVALDGEWTDETSTFPSGDAVPGGDFQFRFNVLPGDTDRSGLTELADGGGIRDRLFVWAGAPSYSNVHDLNGSGRIDFLDWSIVRANLGTPLPAGAPVAPLDEPEASPAAPAATLQVAGEPIAGAVAAPSTLTEPASYASASTASYAPESTASYVPASPASYVPASPASYVPASPASSAPASELAIALSPAAYYLPSPVPRQTGPIVPAADDLPSQALRQAGLDESAASASLEPNLDAGLIDILAEAEFDAYSLGR